MSYTKQGKNDVIVNSLNDLPDAVGGIITLKENTFYNFSGNSITFTDELYLPNECIIMNADIITSQPITLISGESGIRFENFEIRYTGSGTMINAANTGLSLRFVRGNFIASSGTIFDITNTESGFCILDNVLLAGVNLGSIEGYRMLMDATVFTQFGYGLNITNGVKTNIRTLDVYGGANLATNIIEFDGTTQGQVIVETYAGTMGTNEKALHFNPSATYEGVSVSSSVFNDKDRVFASGSYDQSTIGFKFRGNTNIPDSISKGNIYFQESTTETIIDQAEVPVKVNATYTTGSIERFTNGSSLTYSGLEDISVNAICSMVFKPVTGTNILLGGYIAKTEAATIEVTFTNATNLVNKVGHGLSNGTSIRFSTTGTLPAEIRDDQFYYVVNANTDDFQIENLVGDGVHAFTDDGTGTHYYSLGEYIDSSEANSSPSSTRPFGITTLAGVNLSTGDKIEVFVDNHDTTSNIIVSSLQLVVS